MLAEGSPHVLQQFVNQSRAQGGQGFEDMLANLRRDDAGNWVATMGAGGIGAGTHRTRRFTNRLQHVGNGYIPPEDPSRSSTDNVWQFAGVGAPLR